MTTDNCLPWYKYARGIHNHLGLSPDKYLNYN